MTNVTRLQERFASSYQTASKYPCNLIYSRHYKYQLAEYLELLDRQANGIFSADAKAAIDFLEFDAEDEAFRETCVYTCSELDTQLRRESDRHDPICRLIFFTAPTARDKLRADREMFVRITSYHQVPPSFLDFVFSFGEQEQAKDFYFCGFRSEMTLDDGRPLLRLPHLHRSGRELRCSYSFRSVERSTSQPEWPWSIRQSAVYHSYDVDSEVATWIVIKANKLLKTRIKALRDDENRSIKQEVPDIETSRLHTTLEIHLLIASWAAEKWRWYINFLEEKLQQYSNSTLTESVNRASVTPDLLTHKLRRRGSLCKEEKDKRPSSFEHLQGVHFIDEKASEALLIVEADLEVLKDLEDFYIRASKEMRKDERPEDCRHGEVATFRNQLVPIRSELVMHKRRLEALLRLLEGRKSLLRSALQQRSILMNLELTYKAQDSADHMENMTVEMQSIARSTRIETVSMRIITFVTLVYLPGTFISTLMSTPVVTFAPVDYSEGQRHINLQALSLFVEISVPLLLFTVAVWYFFKRTADRKKESKDAS